MDATQFRAARRELGLNTAGLARALGLGKNGYRTVERIEAGSVITGPMQLAMQKLLDDKRGAA